MNRLRQIVLMGALALLVACPAWAGGKIELKQSGGGITELGGVGNAANVNLASEDPANLAIRIESQFEYETVAASQTDQVLGSTGAAGDLLAKLHCVFSAAAVGAVQIKDGTGSAVTVIDAKAGATTVTIDFNIVSTDAGWKITTGTNTTCIGVGRFS